MSTQEKKTASTETAHVSASTPDTDEKKRRRKKKRSAKAKRQRAEVSDGRLDLPVYQPLDPPLSLEALAAQDDDFGNRVDYVSRMGNGIDGYYREPMDGGTQWFQRYRSRRHSNSSSPNDIALTMRQSGWREQRHTDADFQDSAEATMTIRQQSELARSLRYEQHDTPQTQLSRYEQGQDPATAWQRFMDDLKRGRHRLRRKRKQAQKHRHKAKSSATST